MAEERAVVSASCSIDAACGDSLACTPYAPSPGCPSIRSAPPAESTPERACEEHHGAVRAAAHQGWLEQAPLRARVVRDVIGPCAEALFRSLDAGAEPDPRTPLSTRHGPLC